MKRVILRLNWLAILAAILIFCALVFGFVGWDQYQTPRILVEWSTASELNTAGYNLYRSSSPGGDALRINSTLIHASIDPLSGGDYTFTDKDVDPGMRYYYQLEEVDSLGNTESYGLVEIVAKRGGTQEFAISMVMVLFSLIAIHRIINIHSLNNRENDSGEYSG
jgi:hypothetical protein